MHSTLVRAQNVFGFFTTVVFVVSALIAASVVLFPQNPSAAISLRNVQVVRGRPHYYSTKKEEYAHIKFDLDADFSSLFNWNTKQLFIYVLARWPSSSPSANTTTYGEAVIWDQIIPASPDQNPNLPAEQRRNKKNPPTKSDLGIIKLRNVKPKYQISDISGKLAERSNVTLEVEWNVQPWVGALTWTTRRARLGRWSEVKGGKSEPFRFPALKGKAKKDEVVVEKETPAAGTAATLNV